MPQAYFPFASGAGAALTEAQWGQMVRSLITNGVVRTLSNDAGKGVLGNELKVSGDGANRQVNVAIGEAWIGGRYLTSDSIVTLPVGTAHATLTRKDRVVLRLDLSAHTIALDVVAGVAGSSPAPPALQQGSTIWEESLATVTVGPTVTALPDGVVVDERAYARSPSGIHCWASIAYAGGVPTATGSVNVDSLIDNGVGDVTVVFRRVLQTAVYMVMLTSTGAGYGSQDGAVPAPSSVRVQWRDSAHAPVDPGRCYVAVAGDA